MIIQPNSEWVGGLLRESQPNSRKHMFRIEVFGLLDQCLFCLLLNINIDNQESRLRDTEDSVLIALRFPSRAVEHA